MRSAFIVGLALVTGLLIPFPLSAHHGRAAFDAGKEVTIKGTVKEWVYSNPHCLLKLEVTGEDGQVVVWVVEGQSPSVIFPAGYRRDTFKPGEQVTVTVEPVKNNQPLGRILKTVFADGKTLGPASSPPQAAEPQP